MSGESNVEVWDDDFLEELNQVEQLALSSSSYPLSQQPQPQPLHFPNAMTTDNPIISYSPPRHLSQRTAAAPSSYDPKDLEIERLKRELGLVSKQLTEMEHECLELKKDKNEREKLNKLATSKNAMEFVNIDHFKRNQLKNGVSSKDREVPLQLQKTKDLNQDGPHINSASSSCKAVGLQGDLTSHIDLPRKLRAIWQSPRDQEWGKAIVSELFVDCSKEFYVLFGCTNITTTSKVTGSLALKSSIGTLQTRRDTDSSSEAANISHFYSVLTKVGCGMLRLETLLESLLDLSHLDNVVVVVNSLRVLKVLLKHLLTLKHKGGNRENVIVEGVISRNNVQDLHGSCTVDNRLFYGSRDEASSSGRGTFGIRFSDAETLSEKGLWTPDTAPSPCIDWVSLFEMMLQTAMRFVDECIRSEAISIMNVILMSTYAYMEREKFGQKVVLENISQLLKKEAGVQVQMEAVQLLYLLLNCPKICIRLCSGFKEEEDASVADDSLVKRASSQGFGMILESLADCLDCCGNNVQDLKLRRNAIMLLAFVASSGEPGFLILLGQSLPGDANFLMLILQVLAAEIDSEAAADTVSADVFRARTLLVREILILLNRLVSNPSYSSAVLRVLTSSRDLVSLTIDVATRLSRKDGRHWQSDDTSRQMREYEIVDLGRKFKKTVFAHLG